MTDTTTTADSSTNTWPDAAYVGWLRAAVQRPEIRSALRRGDIPAASDRAYRYLARFWNGAPWLQTPILLHAAAIASHPYLKHKDGKSLGDLAADLVHKRVLSDDTLGARLLAVQRMDLTTAHRHLIGLLHTGETQRLGLDYGRLYTLYRWWDQPDLDQRRRTRRGLLEAFHTRIY
jgi:CRISPR type I-E-associated protein CasB/Cse2